MPVAFPRFARHRILSLLLTGAVVVGSSGVRAAEAGGSEDLPQLNMTLFPGQLFWLAVCFGLLYLLMRYVALPRVQNAQDKRKKTIAAELAAAQVENHEARSVMAQYEKALADARAKARAVIEAIHLETENNRVQALDRQQRVLLRQLHDAEIGIVTARTAALGEIQGMATDLSAIIVERLSGIKVAKS